MKRLIIVLILFVFAVPLMRAYLPTTALADSGCMFLSNQSANTAFCDTFSTPAGTGNRSGDLNGTVWGVSHVSGDQNNGLANGWFTGSLNLCGVTVNEQPGTDVRICNGHMVEATNDGGGVTGLAIYPKQPFDIANRTGTVSFNVSDDSQGSHAAWPEFWYSDQPVPTPKKHEDSFLSVPRNGLGIRFANCPLGPDTSMVSVDSMAIVRNYIAFDSFNGTVPFVTNGCVKKSNSTGQFNHIEVQISQNHIDVYGTYAFNIGETIPSLVHLASLSNANLTLTRGLVWMEDAHYNGNKFNSQGTHTFAWGDFAFDGPVLPQDRAFDVLDNTAGGSDGSRQLGWFIPSSSSQVLHTLPVDTTSLTNATGALLTFGFWSEQDNYTFHINVNGHSHTIAYPFTDGRSFSPDTLGIQLPQSDMVDGVNTVIFSTDSSYAINIFNVDVIAVGGGGNVNGGTPTPNPSPSPSPTSTPSPVPTVSPITINNVPCTVVLSGVNQSGTCSGTFTP